MAGGCATPRHAAPRAVYGTHSSSAGTVPRHSARTPSSFAITWKAWSIPRYFPPAAGSSCTCARAADRRCGGTPPSAPLIEWFCVDLPDVHDMEDFADAEAQSAGPAPRRAQSERDIRCVRLRGDAAGGRGQFRAPAGGFSPRRAGRRCSGRRSPRWRQRRPARRGRRRRPSGLLGVAETA